MQPDLTVSVISADNLTLLRDCLDSVFKSCQRATLEVYVVDNASTDDTTPFIQSAYPELTIIRNEERQGFSTNNNTVLEQGAGRYLMLLNDDTLVLDDALDRLVAFMDAHPEVGAVSGAQIDPDGSLQHAFGRFPHPLVEGLWPSANWSHRLVRHRDGPFEVDWVCGAAMMVRRQVVEQVGVLDTAFDPIYSEEIDWCYRIKQAGWKILVLPQAQIIHYGGQTMNRALPHKYELLLSHKAQFFHKHWGAGAAKSYKALLSVSTLAKLIWWSLAAFMSRDHQASRARIRLHWHVLRRIPAL